MTLLSRICTVLALACALAPPAAAADAQIHGITPLGNHIVGPGLGEHLIARARGPGLFVAGSVTALGVDAAQVTAYVRIDGVVVWIGPLAAAAARLGSQVNSGVGVVHAADLGGSAKASFGLAQPLHFQNELRVYVTVDAGAPMSVFGTVLIGKPSP